MKASMELISYLTQVAETGDDPEDTASGVEMSDWYDWDGKLTHKDDLPHDKDEDALFLSVQQFTAYLFRANAGREVDVMDEEDEELIEAIRLSTSATLVDVSDHLENKVKAVQKKKGAMTTPKKPFRSESELTARSNELRSAVRTSMQDEEPTPPPRLPNFTKPGTAMRHRSQMAAHDQEASPSPNHPQSDDDMPSSPLYQRPSAHQPLNRRTWRG